MRTLHRACKAVQQVRHTPHAPPLHAHPARHPSTRLCAHARTAVKPKGWSTLVAESRV